MGEWSYYNFVAGSFHTKKLCSRLFDSNWILFKKTKNRFMSCPLGDLGATCTPFIARWKARDRLPIHHNWTFFAISYGWDVISGNLSKSAFFEGGWVTFSANFRLKGTAPTNHCWCQITRVPFREESKYLQWIVWFCHKARVWQTDRITTANTALA